MQRAIDWIKNLTSDHKSATLLGFGALGLAVVGVAVFAVRKFRAPPPIQPPRFYPNTLEDYEGKLCEVDVEAVNRTIEEFEIPIEENYPSIWQTGKNTNKPKGVSSSIYLGTAGLAYFWWRRHIASPKGNALQRASEYLDRTDELERDHPYPPGAVSFLVGANGSNCLRALIADAKNEPAERDKYLQLVIRGGDSATDPHRTGLEPLFGTTGYLYSCLLMGKYFPNHFPVSHTNKVAEYLISRGKADWVKFCSKIETEQRLCILFPTYDLWPIASHVLGETELNPIKRFFFNNIIGPIGLYLFTAFKKTEYYGLGHGVSATLYYLMYAPDVISNREHLNIIKSTLDFLLELKNKKKIWPIISTNEEAPLVHWCHGSPSYVFLFGRAFEVFEEPNYLAAAVEAAEEVWEKGLLVKGAGLCHGVAGNGYTFLYLYRITSEPRWLHRARQFAKFIIEKHSTLRKADYPYSLYEGTSGTILFLEDIIRDPTESRFPAFEDHIIL